jgi:methanogenic corrinoid protein MtbC1
LTDAEYDRLYLIQQIHRDLLDAGTRQDLATAMRVIEKAERAHIRATDILVGIVAPILYQIGQDWERGARSAAEEHRFTAFFEDVFELLAAKSVDRVPATPIPSQRLDVLLLHAPGNAHTLGIRILSLWLADNGLRAKGYDVSPSEDQLRELVENLRPGLVLISVALAEQFSGAKSMMDVLMKMPREIRPKVIMGGYAVKAGLLSEIPGAEFVTDIGAIGALCKSARI